MDAIDLIREFINDLTPDIVKKQIDTGLRASGKSAASLRTDQPNDKTVQLIDGSGSFEFQDSPGRGPTKGNASSIPLHERIYDWLEYKKYGFNWKDDDERKHLSYAIAGKIHKKGNFIHITGKRTGVVNDVITDGRIDTLKVQVAKIYANDIRQKFLRAFKNN